ncbi:MAG: AIPR family protein [Burkholderiaceae bacterium]|nr:AIPR family protein [Burkholderiaceae bacterium]
MSNNDLILLETILERSHKAQAPAMKPEEFFELFSAEQVLKDLDLSYEELESGLVAGGNDGGIDGLYVFVNEELVQEDTDLSVFKKNAVIDVVIIQAKTSKSFEETPIDKLAVATRDLFRLDSDLDKLAAVYNDGLRAAVTVMRKAWIFLVDRFPLLQFRYVYASKGDVSNLHPNVRRKSELLEAEVKGLFQQAQYRFEFAGAAELFALARRQPKTTYQLTIAESPISAAGDVGYVCLVKLRDYVVFLRDESGALHKALFEANVRDYQGSTQVNTGIQQSLMAKDKEDFWWLNNGVTIVATKATLAGKSLTLEDPQIVNGLQTSTEVFGYFGTANTQGDERSILVRIIVPKEGDPESRDRIIKATNSQTSIPEASLRATDSVHSNIEASLTPFGLFYDRRKNFYKNQGKPAEQIVSIPLMAQAVMSIMLQRPDDARARPSSLLKRDDDYRAIFSNNFPLAMYRVCAQTVKRVDEFLRTAVGFDAKDKTNIRFFVAMHVTACAGAMSNPGPQKIASLDLGLINPDSIYESAVVVMKIYERLGGGDQIAKGPLLREQLKLELQTCYPIV